MNHISLNQMLDTKTIKKINDFVYSKPRSINEIASLIERNWRTADSYVDKISKELGTISTRTFRGGTRGALKVVYWNNVEKIHSSEFQERLFKRIEAAKGKNEFSPFDIYQYVPDEHRYAFLEEQSDNIITKKQNLVNLLRSAEHQILIFSGNLSWVTAKQGKEDIINILEEAAERNISIKILCKVDVESIDNIKKMLELNYKLKKDLIEIRHAEQPFRAFVIDDKIARFKEIKHYEVKTKKSDKMHIFYEIRDEEWLDWIQKIFWNLFRTSIMAEKRIQDIETIEKIK